MSNIDTAIYTSDKQLFSELTPEEGAVIEGGKTLFLYKATALRASSDLGGVMETMSLLKSTATKFTEQLKM